MDKLALGKRIAQARVDAGMTQDGLGRAVDLDRTAITRLEKGERKLSVPELVAIAQVLGRPLSYFVSTPVPAAVSRRRDAEHAHESTRALDNALEDFAADIQVLVEMKLIDPPERPAATGPPADHAAAEQMAQRFRRQLDLDNRPIQDLGEVCQRLGLLTFSAPLGKGGPDGGRVEVGSISATVGAAVINGDAPAGRRRMTLTHELGHWLSGDAYDLQASLDSERMINSFAIHFLAPRAGIQEIWNKHAGEPIRDRALTVGASFRLSWSAAVSQLKNVNLISHDVHRALSEHEPRSGDYVRLGLSWTDELASPYLSPGFASACVIGFVSGRLTAERTVELLRGTLSADELPRREDLARDELRRSFAGHGN